MPTEFVPKTTIEEGKKQRNITFYVPLSLEEDIERYITYTLPFLVLEVKYPDAYPYFSLHKEEGKYQKCYGFPRPKHEDYLLMKHIAKKHNIIYEELAANAGFLVTFPPFTSAEDMTQEAKHQLHKVYKAVEDFFSVLYHPSYKKIKAIFTEGIEKLIAMHLQENEEKEQATNHLLDQQQQQYASLFR